MNNTFQQNTSKTSLCEDECCNICEISFLKQHNMDIIKKCRNNINVI